jgi:hypothetical protein
MKTFRSRSDYFYLNVRSEDERDPLIPPFRMGEYGYWDDHPLASRR